MALRTPIGRARGLGSAKEGVGHHQATNLTAVGLIPLSLWFVVSIIGLHHADYAVFKAWIGKPLNASLFILTILLVTYHAAIGLQTVIEDYVHCECKKSAGLLATKLVGAFLAVFSTVSILKVAVGG